VQPRALAEEGEEEVTTKKTSTCLSPRAARRQQRAALQADHKLNLLGTDRKKRRLCAGIGALLVAAAAAMRAELIISVSRQKRHLRAGWAQAASVMEAKICA